MPHTPTPQDAKSLQAEQRELRSALAASEGEVSFLSTQLEQALEQLAAARRQAADAQAAATSAGGRVQVLEQAWEAAMGRQGEH